MAGFEYYIHLKTQGGVRRNEVISKTLFINIKAYVLQIPGPVRMADMGRDPIALYNIRL